MARFIRSLRLVLLAGFSVGLLFSGTSASAAGGEAITPATGSPEAALLAGLELIEDGKFDAWISRFCHQEDLCYNANSIKSLKKYNLPAMKRLAPQCIKAGGKLEVTRKDKLGDDYLKIFITCNPKGMPRPFHLKKQGKDWKFKKI